MKVTAHATRSEGWWTVVAPDVGGAVTQVKRLDEAADMMADAVALLDEIDVESIQVEIIPHIDPDSEELIAAAKASAAVADEAVKSAADANRAMIRRLRSQGLTVREVARVTHLSPGRVSQLERAQRPTAGLG